MKKYILIIILLITAQASASTIFIIGDSTFSSTGVGYYDYAIVDPPTGHSIVADIIPEYGGGKVSSWFKRYNDTCLSATAKYSCIVAANPDVIIVNIGFNDCWYPQEPFLSIKNVAANYVALFSDLRADFASAKLFFMTEYPLPMVPGENYYGSISRTDFNGCNCAELGNGWELWNVCEAGKTNCCESSNGIYTSLVYYIFNNPKTQTLGVNLIDVRGDLLDHYGTSDLMWADTANFSSTDTIHLDDSREYYYGYIKPAIEKALKGTGANIGNINMGGINIK